MQWEEAQRLAHRAMEIEEGRLDMASDRPDETSEGLEDDDGPPDALPSVVPTSGASAAAGAVFTKAPGEEPERKLYMVLIRCWTVEGLHVRTVSILAYVTAHMGTGIAVCMVWCVVKTWSWAETRTLGVRYMVG